MHAVMAIKAKLSRLNRSHHQHCSRMLCSICVFVFVYLCICICISVAFPPGMLSIQKVLATFGAIQLHCNRQWGISVVEAAEATHASFSCRVNISQVWKKTEMMRVGRRMEKMMRMILAMMETAQPLFAGEPILSGRPNCCSLSTEQSIELLCSKQSNLETEVSHNRSITV